MNSEAAHRDASGPDLDRIVRRETHSTRAAVAIAAAVLVLVGAGYGLLEAGVHAIGQPPWLLDPRVAGNRLVQLPAGVPTALLAALGAVLAMLGLVFFLNGILPGRRARHVIRASGPGSAVVVDDEVIASALARRARLAANVTPDQVMVVVSRRQVVVNVRPTSGVPVDQNEVLAAVQDELDQMALEPAPAARINVASSGVIGA
ncbi:DUF6286 domain-containing protein [Pseudarthrobacter sp. NPDC058362]|uniref:DUF6286 domain-containing protein n=1 Tax=Pseudarthrobacter sp. NPDC058362 TaxID=3346458 RepID=UPI0036521830